MKKISLYSAMVLLLSFYLQTSHAAPPTKAISGENLLSGSNTEMTVKGKKGLVVVFLSAKCPCSDSHNTELKDLAKSYTDFNFVAIHSNVDEDKTLSQAYFKKVSFPFPVIQDRQATLADRFQALKTPHAFVFSPEGKTLYEGGVSDSRDCSKAETRFLKDALEDVQKGRTVRTPEGRTLGCAISRGEQNVW